MNVYPQTKGIKRHRALRLLRRNGIPLNNARSVDLRKKKVEVFYRDAEGRIYEAPMDHVATRKVRLHRG